MIQFLPRIFQNDAAHFYSTTNPQQKTKNSFILLFW